MHRTPVMTKIRSDKLCTLESIIGVSFSSLDLLNQAFIHPSFTGENGLPHSSSNQRLEFLGDSVVYIVTATALYEKYPYKDEGELTTKRIALIREETLAKMAEFYHLDEYLLLSKGGALTHIASQKGTLCDTFEALLGAIYLDKGLDGAKAFILRSLKNCGIEL